MIVRARDNRATSGECSCCWPPLSSPSSSAGPPFTHRGSAMSTSSTPRSIAPLMSRNFLYVLIFSWPERSKVFRSFVVSKIWNRKATTLRYLFHVSGFFYYFSATINPILYNVMSLKYRCSIIEALMLSAGFLNNDGWWYFLHNTSKVYLIGSINFIIPESRWRIS